MSEEIAGIGHNQPPADPLKARTDNLVSSANAWAASDIADQDNADRLSAFIDQINKQIKALDDAKEEAEKRPHLDVSAEIEKRFKPLKALLETAKALVNPKLTAWLQKLSDEKAERVRAAKAEADKLLADAQEARAKAAIEAAKGGDVVGATVAAQEASRAADVADDAVRKIVTTPVNLQSSLGARTKSLRTFWHGRVTSHLLALQHFRNHPDVIALVAKLAEQSAGENATSIPGVEFFSDQKAV